MTMRRLVLALALLAPLAALAITPDELLPDPAEEARAREISRELRCVVCQSESIATGGMGKIAWVFRSRVVSISIVWSRHKKWLRERSSLLASLAD